MWHHLLTSELENVSKMRQLKFPSLWLSVYLSNFQISASTPGTKPRERNKRLPYPTLKFGVKLTRRVKVVVEAGVTNPKK